MQLEKLKKMYNEKGYTFFERGDYNLNLFGIRSSNKRAGFFDDIIGVAYKVNNQWQLLTWSGTVDCGDYYLKNPMHPDGSAFMCEGQYKGLWFLGSFHNRPALIQKAHVKYYRDNNRDEIIDLDPDTITEGNIGLFFHSHMQLNPIADIVANSSAGCQVLKSDKDFSTLIGLCVQSSAIYGNSFTYTLF
jgi:hypothetical protein